MKVKSVKIEYLLLITFAIGLKLGVCIGTFEIEKAYLNSIKYSYEHPTLRVSAAYCIIAIVTNDGEGKKLECTRKGKTISCGCSQGIVNGLTPDTDYTLVIKNDPAFRVPILAEARFKTASKYNLISDKITSDSYEYQASVDESKVALDACRVCLVEGGTNDQCCTANYYTAKQYCKTNKFTGLRAGSVYEFIMCDIVGGQSIKKRFITHIRPKSFSVVFNDKEVTYLLTYPGDITPTGSCVGSFLGQDSPATCKADTECSCIRGTFQLPSDKTDLRFQLKLDGLIFVDYTPNGPGPENPSYYTGSLKGQRLTTAKYTISSKEGGMEEATCNFYTQDDSAPIECLEDGDVKKTDCKCTSGKLVGLSSDTDYRIKVVLKSSGETILSYLRLKTAEIGKITKEYIGLNKYKYKLSYSDENNKPDVCRICLEDRTIEPKCCTISYYTNPGHCSTSDFTVEADMPRSLRFKICDLDGSVMINHDVEMPLAPTSTIILLYDDQIRYKLTYKDNNTPKGCKFYINDIEKSDLHCASNMPCDCEKGAFIYITDDNTIKFTIGDMEGNELASKELDKYKKDEYFTNTDEACSTFGI